MAAGARESCVLMLFLCSPVMCQITGPTKLNYFVGKNAQFRWNTASNSTILSATWGIRKGNIADPQFINVDVTSSKVNLNSGLKPDLIKRLKFDGDLKTGRAWFTLMNVTVEDTNVYLASISDDVNRFLPYTVVLIVKEKEREQKDGYIVTSEGAKKTIDHSPSPEIARTTPTKVTETEVHTPKDPRNPVNSNDHYLPTIIAVPVAMVVLLVFIAFLYKFYSQNKSPKKKGSGTNSSKNKLMGAIVHI